jgi:Flp pilus assembly protein TadD
MILGRNLVSVLVAALLCGCAGLAPVSHDKDADRKLSEAIERELPSLKSAGDYWAASRAYFQLASVRTRLNETRAACIALSNSLGYYRRALATETDSPLYESDTDLGDGEGELEIRSMFGCVVERSAEPFRGGASPQQARRTRISPA